MRIWGVDFASAPRRAKPIMVARAWLTGNILTVQSADPLPDFAAFEAFLAQPGPWLAGFDLPFTQSRRFLGGVGWPLDWGGLRRSAGRADPHQISLDIGKVQRKPGGRRS